MVLFLGLSCNRRCAEDTGKLYHPTGAKAEASSVPHWKMIPESEVSVSMTWICCNSCKERNSEKIDFRTINNRT